MRENSCQSVLTNGEIDTQTKKHKPITQEILNKTLLVTMQKKLYSRSTDCLKQMCMTAAVMKWWHKDEQLDQRQGSQRRAESSVIL